MRRTIRAYKSDPVSKEILRELLETAQLAPSWGNTQPWEFVVFTGEAMEQVTAALVAKTEAREEPNSDIPRPDFPEELRRRAEENGRRMYGAMGINRDDTEGRQQFSMRNSRFFGAPVGVLLVMDRSLGPWSMLDIGLIMQTIMLASQAYGLGSSPLYGMVRYPDVLRDILQIPDSKQIVCGIALGYPDPDAPQNNFSRQREPLDAISSWHGFDYDPDQGGSKVD
jgi:nitroreductase